MSHQFHYTPSGAPYIALTTGSPIPIYLTPLKETDAEQMQKNLSIESINNALISAPKPYTIESARWWISQNLAGLADLSLCALRASDPETGTLIGAASLAPHDGGFIPSYRARIERKEGEGRDVDLGYHLHPDWRGKGITREAVRAVVGWGMREEGVRKVVVRVLEENIESRRVVEGMSEFVRVNGMDDYMEYPENKGGGKRRCFIWEWKA
ncbi:uncharacterized protein PAC_06354 [Phialocephala subalpina]|uniref:N-acetyltransferase domain-containing protein n=1 Tax=Phialocephala subalpina TaxID=576137 RepID=A0A1L7WUK7_9HELO|nr:uncharacterized protein PAC_06354 [Phialocephala subalpina]